MIYLKRLIYILLFFIAFFSCYKLQAQTNTYGFKLIPIDYDLHDVLKSYSGFKGDSSAIAFKEKELINDLQNKGYLSASIDSVRYDSTSVFVYIFFGKKYTWGNLDYSKLDYDLVELLNPKRLKKKSTVVNIRKIENIKKQILAFYLNSGYPFASVYFDNFEIKDSIFNASLLVDKGDFYTIDSIYIKGDAKISSNYIKKTIQLDHGMEFNQQKISDIGNKIADLSFISEIKPAELEFRANEVDLYLYLKNKKANMFNGIIGFLPDENNGKLLITGDLTLHLVNSFKHGEELFLNWEKLESSTQKLNLGFNYPYLFKSNFGFDFDFELYKKDSSYLSVNTGLGLRLFLSNDDYLKAYYRYKSSSRIANENVNTTQLNVADVKSNIIGVLYSYNNVDYKFNPRKGILLNTFGGAGFKSISNNKSIDTLNPNIDKNTVELEAGLDLNLYFPIYGNFVFHFGNQTRYLDQFANSGKENILFENELYRFGGAKTLRGFDESIFLASIYSIQNVELKYLFERNSSFYAFWNGAYYYKNVAQGVTEDFPWGFGIGLDFDTKAGIFSLSYALGKQFDNPIEIKTAKIHFGYISRF